MTTPTANNGESFLLVTGDINRRLSMLEGAKHIASRFDSRQWWIMAAMSAEAAIPVAMVAGTVALKPDGRFDTCEVLIAHVLIDEISTSFGYRIVFIAKDAISPAEMARFMTDYGIGEEFDQDRPHDFLAVLAENDRADVLTGVFDKFLKFGREANRDPSRN